MAEDRQTTLEAGEWTDCFMTIQVVCVCSGGSEGRGWGVGWLYFFKLIQYDSHVKEIKWGHLKNFLFLIEIYSFFLYLYPMHLPSILFPVPSAPQSFTLQSTSSTEYIVYIAPGWVGGA